MCGLVGIAGDITHDARKTVFRDMLDVCQVRGRDSTGVVAARRGEGYTWAKAVGAPVYLYETRAYENKIESGTLPLALIGHTRSKTIGDVNVKNAHPFDIEERGICGVHNGTLRGYYSMDTYVHTKVDSEVLYGHLAKNGVADTFNREIGAYACIWWDEKERTLNFIRNKERPLWFTWSKDMKMIFWASEPWMFGVVSRKIDLWNGENDDGKNRFFELPTHTHWAFMIDPSKKEADDIVTQVICDTVEVKAVQSAYRFQGGHQRSIWEEFEGSDGVWTRDPKTGQWSKVTNDSKAGTTVASKTETSSSKGSTVGGGEVVNPFSQEKKAEEELNDPIPFVPSTKQTKNEKDGSKLSNLSFMKPAVHSQGTSTGSPSTNEPSSSTESQQTKSSMILLPKSSEGQSSKPSKGSEMLRTKSSVTSLPSPVIQQPHLFGVSFRTIHGLTYVTNRSTNEEYEVTLLLQNNKGKCCFCKGDMTTGSDIGLILSNGKKIMCTDCVQPTTSKLVSVK